MCISISEADAIHISMHSQRYDALKIHMKPLAMRCDSTLLRCSRFHSTQCDSMQWKKYERFYFFGSDRQQIINCLMFILASKKRLRGLFHKTRLPNRPGLFHLKINLSHCGYLCWRANLVQGRRTVRLS